MLDIQQNVLLTQANTLALKVRARYLLELVDAEHLPEALHFAEQRQLPVLVLGGGSNVVLSKDFHGLVIVMQLRGITVELTAERALLTAAAGESWHPLVEYCLQHGYYGVENLALIPGTVGAAPIQNIGAYGVELSSLFHSLRGWDRQQRCWRTLHKSECEFGYRDSIFKQRLQGEFIITEVSLALSLSPQVHTDYAALQQALFARGLATPSPRQVADCVIAIRQSKLPDPQSLPNVGSFFKNPVLSPEQAVTWRQQFPAAVCYPQADGSLKIAAGWLLDQAGWKGKRQGAVGMHAEQALVLVNYAHASGAEVLALAHSIQQEIFALFALTLEIEPAIY